MLLVPNSCTTNIISPRVVTCLYRAGDNGGDWPGPISRDAEIELMWQPGTTP